MPLRWMGFSGSLAGMSPRFQSGLSVVLGLTTASLIFSLANFDYNLFGTPFEFGKAAVRLGVPAATTLIWFAIFRAIFQPDKIRH